MIMDVSHLFNVKVIGFYLSIKVLSGYMRPLKLYLKFRVAKEAYLSSRTKSSWSRGERKVSGV